MRGVSLVVLGGAMACNAVTGLDDLEFAHATGGAAQASTTSSATSNATATGAGGQSGGGTSGSGYTAAVLADQPLGYWRLGEAPGAATAIDSSGNDHPGSYFGPALVLGVEGAIA